METTYDWITNVGCWHKKHVVLHKKKKCHITPHLPITATSPQRPLSSVPKVAVVERFKCIIIIIITIIIIFFFNNEKNL